LKKEWTDYTPSAGIFLACGQAGLMLNFSAQ
jgi:hypothetical protein